MSDDKDNTIITMISNAIEPLKLSTGDACLVMISGRDLGKKFSLSIGQTVVGRSPKTNLQLDEEEVSRNHAVFTNDGGRVLVRDLGSTNGTYVNDVIIRGDHTLREGDLVKVGRTIFKFLSGNNIEQAYHEEIYRLTTTDGLTQIFNKRYLIESLERELSRSVRYGRDLSFILFDIDHFKRINDTFGHLAGDAVLKQLAQLVQRSTRRDDLLARYGGEEFAIVCPECDLVHASAVAEKLRALIASSTFIFDASPIPLTVSMGVADTQDYLRLFPDTRASLHTFELIKVADDRLYLAKNQGRNRVVSHS
jgi:two-component system, cell cycle response regulator